MIYCFFLPFLKKERSLHQITADKTPKLISDATICIKSLIFEFFFTIGNFRNSDIFNIQMM